MNFTEALNRIRTGNHVDIFREGDRTLTLLRRFMPDDPRRLCMLRFAYDAGAIDILLKNSEAPQLAYERACDRLEEYGMSPEAASTIMRDFCSSLSWEVKDAAERLLVKAKDLFENGDLESAYECFIKAALKGDSTAMSVLGVMYCEGQGIAQSGLDGVFWYKKAADAGNPAAMHNLGVMYDTGTILAQSDQEAYNWYKKAAKAGDEDSMQNLGVMYANGQGVPQSRSEAVAWYKKAAQRGQADAIEYLNSMGIPY